MIELSYTLSGDFMDLANEPNYRAIKTDLKTVNDADLDYRLFLGDFVLRQGEVDFSTHLRWLPVLNFATYLAAIANELNKKAGATYDFTESEWNLTFKRMGGRVSINASYADGTIEVEYEELKSTSRNLFQKVTDDLLEKYPDLRENGPFMKRAAVAKHKH